MDLYRLEKAVNSRGTRIAPSEANPRGFAKGRLLGRFWLEKDSWAMLKRLSSLILALMLGGSVLAGTARLQKEHVCEMADMEMMPGMEAMPCCKKHGTDALVSKSGFPGQCCVTIPQEPGSSGTTFNLRTPSFSIAVIHPAIVQSPVTLPKPYERPYSTQVFLPNLQATYIRNLSFLI